MKKKLFLIITVLCICLSGFCVYADESADKNAIGVWTFTGKLYYCDSPTDRVVIKSIKPIVSSPDAEQAGNEAEYLEIKISPEGLRMADGTAVMPEDLNTYADSDVWFTLLKLNDGYLTIPYLCFR